MPKPGEHKTVQSRILKYVQEIGWTFVPRADAEARRGFNPHGTSLAERAGRASLYFDDVLYRKVREFNPLYRETKGALVGRLRHLQANIFGNREFLSYLRNAGTFFCAEEGRELDLRLIDYDDIDNNCFQVTEEFSIHNGAYGNREDIVFLINGIPVAVIECKNADTNEAIALGIDQIRRYHDETPELFVPEMVFTATEAIGFSYGLGGREDHLRLEQKKALLEQLFRTLLHKLMTAQIRVNDLNLAELGIDGSDSEEKETNHS